MRAPGTRSARGIIVWAALAIILAVPLSFAASSPQLEWRGPIYIAAGFAGVVGLALMLIQPLLIGGYLPGFTPYQARRVHRWVGTALVAAVVVHVAALWITSPPDVVDALLFDSPTPFSAWGVIAMWAVFLVAVMVALRGRLGLRPRTWRLVHTGLVLVIVAGTVIHSVLITGTMETLSKAALCALVIIATLKVIADIRFRPGKRNPQDGTIADAR
ncbi:MAG: ferric reductase-like transmembrane domain-containing protein [Pseudomonadota bacterium]